VAIKIFKRKLDTRPEDIMKEIEILRSLKHENIISYLDYYEIKDESYLITEYCSNGTLDTYFSKASNPLTELQI
jgi:serine/threonine protein kinase